MEAIIALLVSGAINATLAALVWRLSHIQAAGGLHAYLATKDDMKAGKDAKAALDAAAARARRAMKGERVITNPLAEG